ncbi:MAG: sensor histidine kinase, partial [Bacteroidota bacterium]
KLAADGFEASYYEEGFASALNNIGLLYQEMKNFNDALPYYKKSLAIRKEIEDTYGISASLMNIGLAFDDMQELDSAKYFFNKSIELKRAINDQYGLSRALNNLAVIYRKEKNFDAAEPLFAEALNIKRTMGDKHTVASSILNLSAMRFMQGRYQSAITLLEEGITISEELKTYNHLFKLYSQMGDNLAKLGRFEEAFRYKDMAEPLKDSTYSQTMTEKFLELETQYETEKQQQQINIQRLEIDAQKAKTRNQQIIGLALIAALLAVAMIIYYRFIVRLRLQRQQKQLEIRENLVKERERISRDLHDNVGAQLTQIINKLDVTGFKLNQGSKLNLTEGIEDISDTARDTITQLRETIWAIQQAEFTLPQFEQRVRQYLNQYLNGLPQPESFEVIMPVDYPLNLSSNQALNLFRIIQEATQNVVKHAQANQLRIQLEPAYAAVWQLTIKDNGIGFDINDQPEGHYGLQNMNSRAESMNGQLHLESTPGIGSTIRIEFPELKTAV